MDSEYRDWQLLILYGAGILTHGNVDLISPYLLKCITYCNFLLSILCAYQIIVGLQQRHFTVSLSVVQVEDLIW